MPVSGARGPYKRGVRDDGAAGVMLLDTVNGVLWCAGIGIRLGAWVSSVSAVVRDFPRPFSFFRRVPGFGGGGGGEAGGRRRAMVMG